MSLRNVFRSSHLAVWSTLIWVLYLKQQQQQHNNKQLEFTRGLNQQLLFCLNALNGNNDKKWNKSTYNNINTSLPVKYLYSYAILFPLSVCLSYLGEISYQDTLKKRLLDILPMMRTLERLIKRGRHVSTTQFKEHFKRLIDDKVSLMIKKIWQL